MLLTIAAILATLLALFKVFGWTLGVVEAVALSILVGNSLDYCIHLVEGYVSVDERHLVFVDKYLVRVACGWVAWMLCGFVGKYLCLITYKCISLSLKVKVN